MAIKRRKTRRRRRIGSGTVALPNSIVMGRARRRRSIGATRKKSSRRRSSSGGSMSLKPMDIALAVGGALVANAYMDRIPIADPRYRYAAAAVGAYVLAGKVPKQFKPALLGAAIVAGGKAATAFFPDLLNLGQSTASAAAVTGMGRLTPMERSRVIAAAQRQGRRGIGAFNHPVITGPGGQSIITGIDHRFGNFRVGGGNFTR